MAATTASSIKRSHSPDHASETSKRSKQEKGPVDKTAARLAAAATATLSAASQQSAPSAAAAAASSDTVTPPIDSITVDNQQLASYLTSSASAAAASNFHALIPSPPLYPQIPILSEALATSLRTAETHSHQLEKELQVLQTKVLKAQAECKALRIAQAALKTLELDLAPKTTSSGPDLLFDGLYPAVPNPTNALSSSLKGWEQDPVLGNPKIDSPVPESPSDATN